MAAAGGANVAAVDGDVACNCRMVVGAAPDDIGLIEGGSAVAIVAGGPDAGAVVSSRHGVAAAVEHDERLGAVAARTGPDAGRAAGAARIGCLEDASVEGHAAARLTVVAADAGSVLHAVDEQLSRIVAVENGVNLPLGELLATNKGHVLIDDTADGNDHVARFVGVAHRVVENELGSLAAMQGRRVGGGAPEGVMGAVRQREVQPRGILHVRALGGFGSILGVIAVGEDVDRRAMVDVHAIEDDVGLPALPYDNGRRRVGSGVCDVVDVERIGVLEGERLGSEHFHYIGERGARHRVIGAMELHGVRSIDVVFSVFAALYFQAADLGPSVGVGVGLDGVIGFGRGEGLLDGARGRLVGSGEHLVGEAGEGGIGGG